jgi:Spy/CpxP family protein refolding chaperone
MAKRLAILATVCVLILVLCTAVQAQPPKGKGGGPGGRGFGAFGMGGMGFGGGTSFLLRNEKVQEELSLTEAQKTKIEALFKEGIGKKPDMGGFRDLSEEERKAKRAEMMEKAQARAKKLTKDIDEILKPEQRKRLNEIQLQLRGINALRDKAVATELGLSQEQQDKIAEIGKEAAEKRSKLFGEGADPSGRREKMDKIQKETETATLNVLTKEQKDKFKEMQGAKFDTSSLMQGFGPGGRRGGGKAKPKAEPEA